MKRQDDELSHGSSFRGTASPADNPERGYSSKGKKPSEIIVAGHESVKRKD